MNVCDERNSNSHGRSFDFNFLNQGAITDLDFSEFDMESEEMTN
jgi:hypothetical protein